MSSKRKSPQDSRGRRVWVNVYPNGNMGCAWGSRNAAENAAEKAGATCTRIYTGIIREVKPPVKTGKKRSK